MGAATPPPPPFAAAAAAPRSWQVTGEREKCYLVGLEASGWGMKNKKGTKGSFPEARPASGERCGVHPLKPQQQSLYSQYSINSSVNMRFCRAII